MNNSIIILNYALENRSWLIGNFLYNNLLELKRNVVNDKESPQYQHFFQSIGNQKWFSIAEKYNGNWPHPYNIFKKLSERYNFENIYVDWIPELNYLVLFPTNKEMEIYIKEKFKQMV